MSGKATLTLLEQIHNRIAKDMLDKLTEGTCEAKDWAVIVKFLKDNSIDLDASAQADTGNAFDNLVREASKRINEQTYDLQ